MRTRITALTVVSSGAVTLLLWGGCGSLSAADPAPPLSPRDALKAFRTEPDLRVELVAAEPDVVDPVAMAFDARGRLFVVEARGYPTDLGRGVVAILEDPDGDGIYKRGSTFAEGLSFPTGLLPWREGLFVTDSPDVLFLEDTDGDGRADSSEVILTGFATDRSTQLRVNDPTLGLDGQIYLAGGLSGGQVRSARHPDLAAIDLTRMDARFDPATGVPAAIDGKSQFGLAFDDFGRRFICMNRVQAQHVVISSRQLARNPYLAFSDTVHDLPEERIEDLLKGHNAAARIYPLSDNVTTADSHAGTFSAACAVTVWRGGGLPDRYRGQVFSCDPTGNLVLRDELLPEGATFRAHRSPEEIELLASADNWFRPVFLATGTGGGLYVCDMYRRVIEHPDYLPLEVRGRMDFQSGRDRGRIYRIAGPEAPRAEKEAPASRATEALVSDLQSDHSWRRDTAFRLLLERAEVSSVPALERVLLDARSPPGEVMAAYLLEHLRRLAPRHLLPLLRSPDAGVREVALELAAPRLGGDEDLARAVTSLSADPDPRVRFACALALGEMEAAKATDEALAEIARRGAGDRWTRAAVISSARGREAALLEKLLARPRVAADAGELALIQDLARAGGSSGPNEELGAMAGRLLVKESSDGEVWPFALLVGLTRAVLKPLELVREDAPASAVSLERWNELVDRARRIASDPTALTAARLLAIELLGLAAPPGTRQTLAQLIETAHPPDLQLAAVRALGRTGDGAGAMLRALERWPYWPAAVRETVLAQFIADANFAAGLLLLVEQEAIAAASLSIEARKHLLPHRDDSVRGRAKTLFAAVERDRMKVLEAYRPALELRGNPESGRAVFRGLCAPCHRLEREGIDVGPDLFGVRDQEKETLLLHIIVPNREIPSGFEATVVITNEGETLIGWVTSETRASITIRQKGGLERTLLRDDVVSITVSSVSLMPEGLEATLSLQGMADVLAYLRGEG